MLPSRRSPRRTGALWLAASWVLGCTQALPAPVPVPKQSVQIAPIGDADRDGITDAWDACPNLPGIRSSVIIENGCPPTGYYDDGLGTNDRDGDGVPDTADACGDSPGVATPAAETNGCPVAMDSDADGVADSVDACPNDAGPARDDPKFSGCPLAFVMGDRIHILSPVRFASGSAELLAESDAVLGAVAGCLAARPDTKKVAVEGHTDDRGSPAGNRALSRRRAERVVAWLVAHGTEQGRLEADGLGAQDPIETNQTEAGRATNRRVEFRLFPAESTPAPPPSAASPVYSAPP
jgi:OOP family OmpA-OmpF porin